MQREFDMSTAGSLTLAFLFIAVIFLLRSFYKRYTKLDRTDDSSEE